MYQKGKIIAWRRIALLSVLSIGISLFAMLPIQALADTSVNPTLIPVPTRNTVLLGIWRPSGSTIGSVFVKDQTDPTKLSQCINLSQQGTVYGLGKINGQDTIVVDHYPGANCQGTDSVNRESSKTYTGIVNSLPPGATNGSLRIYETPKDA